MSAVPAVPVAGDAAPAPLPTPPDGVQHLASPDSLPPGSTMDPAARDPEDPNLSYLKDLWHAVQNQEISGSEALLMGLAQRGMDTPYPKQAAGPNVPISPADPAAAPADARGSADARGADDPEAPPPPPDAPPPPIPRRRCHRPLSLPRRLRLRLHPSCRRRSPSVRHVPARPIEERAHRPHMPGDHACPQRAHQRIVMAHKGCEQQAVVLAS